jgi:hypothetical protein
VALFKEYGAKKSVRDLALAFLSVSSYGTKSVAGGAVGSRALVSRNGDRDSR